MTVPQVRFDSHSAAFEESPASWASPAHRLLSFYRMHRMVTASLYRYAA